MLVRSGDTPAAARAAMLKRPPHLLITTPESLFLLVTAERSRERLRRVRTLIVDEIHAVARDKRGSHLALTLERLEALCAVRPARIGLSATQRPIETIARLLVGEGPGRSDAQGRPACAIVDVGHRRALDLEIVVPASELEAVASGEQWGEMLDQIAGEVEKHRTTLVFSNTRRLAERVAHLLEERLGEGQVAAHHGSLSKERRLRVEERLRAGDLRVLVATASLELGIDIGPVELVCQLGSPRSIATLLQRVGRSGHSRGAIPKGRLYPTTRDELVESAALLRAVRLGHLDRVRPPRAPLDILAQQMVAACAADDWAEDALFALVRPRGALRRARARGFRRGGRDALRGHPDRARPPRRLSAPRPRERRAARPARRAARRAHLGRRHPRDRRLPRARRSRRHLRRHRQRRLGDREHGGRHLPARHHLVAHPPRRGGRGARERRAGAAAHDPVLARRGARAHRGALRRGLGAARGASKSGSLEQTTCPARSPGWRPSAGSPASRPSRCCATWRPRARRWARSRPSRGSWSSASSTRRAACSSSCTRCFGGRVNRAFGLAVRKRICRAFDFELQAAANDDALVLSLGPQHSFPLPDFMKMLSARTLPEVLAQAVLASPMFTARWRWNLGRSLAVLRMKGGKRNPPPIQRMEADDLMAAVFPGLAQCQENQAGPIEIPDHPLVRQTLHDCLHEAMDVDALGALLGAIESGGVSLHLRETTEPSPLAHEILNGRPFTFLDDAPLEERRTRAVVLRRGLPETARDLGRLDPEAIARVREEAAPAPRDAEELHDTLLSLVVVAPRADWEPGFEELVRDGPRGARRDRRRRALVRDRAARRRRGPLRGRALPARRGAPGGARGARAGAARRWPRRRSCAGISTPRVRSRSRRSRTATRLSPAQVEQAIARLEAEGFALRGSFSPERGGGEEVCARRLLARIHLYTHERLRREIEPVTAQDFLRFLLRWQHVAPGTQREGRRGVLSVVEQLQGFELAAGAWEEAVLPARVAGYRREWLDALCLSGEVVWARLGLRRGRRRRGAGARGRARRGGALARDADRVRAARGAAGAARGGARRGPADASR